MTKFLYAYTGGGVADTPEAREASMKAWEQWLGGLGPALVDVGAPFGASKNANGGAPSGLTGYSILEADSLDDAVAKTAGCPIFANGGDVEVYEALAM